LERSIKTLDVRVQRQNENAFAVAEFLESQHAVTKVLYPGLSSHRRHVLAASQMRGFGGMVSFELHADASLRDFLTSLKLITPAMSLGGVESTISVPVFTSHKQISEEERQQTGVTRNLLRFSTGIENKDDLIADFTQAFANCHVVGAREAP
jgi:cystathionine beta-lyase